MIDILKSYMYIIMQLDEFGEKYTPVKPSPRSVLSRRPSPPKVSSQPLYLCLLLLLVVVIVVVVTVVMHDE